MNSTSHPSRRHFLSTLAVAGAGLAALPGCATVRREPAPLFDISLAEWSLHRALRNRGTMNNLDFPAVTRQAYHIGAVEFVNQFFKDKADDTAYLTDLKGRCNGEGVRCLLIMCDGEGRLGDPDEALRNKAVENHHQWVRAAKFLGCHSIRVNADSANQGTFEEQQKRAADGLASLSEFAATMRINVIVENHGGLSSHGAWLAGVMKMVNLPNFGTLPDFGNFPPEINRYDAVEKMMPFAKAVSAKSHEFDAEGNEVHTDYTKMMRIVLSAGYRGFVGIEYEGGTLSEPDGIRATKALLERVREQLSTQFS